MGHVLRQPTHVPGRRAHAASPPPPPADIPTGVDSGYRALGTSSLIHRVNACSTTADSPAHSSGPVGALAHASYPSGGSPLELCHCQKMTPTGRSMTPARCRGGWKSTASGCVVVLCVLRPQQTA